MPLDGLAEALALGAVADHDGPQVRQPASRRRDRARDQVRALLGDQPSGERDERLRRAGARLEAVLRRGVQPVELDHRAPQPLAAQAPGVQVGEHERQRGRAHARALDGVADPPARGAEVVAPVVGRPDLEPVDGDHRAGAGECDPRGEQGEERERARVHRVVGAAVAQQVAQDPETEAQRRSDPAPAGRAVKRAAGRHGDHVDAGDARASRPRATPAA